MFEKENKEEISLEGLVPYTVFPYLLPRASWNNL